MPTPEQITRSRVGLACALATALLSLAVLIAHTHSFYVRRELVDTYPMPVFSDPPGWESSPDVVLWLHRLGLTIPLGAVALQSLLVWFLYRSRRNWAPYVMGGVTVGFTVAAVWAVFLYVAASQGANSY